MSAIVSYLRVNSAQLTDLLKTPEGVRDWWALFEQDLPPRSGLVWDTDVYWHLVHYVLNGEPNRGVKPLWDAVLGGTCFVEGPIGEDYPRHFLADIDKLWETCRYLRPDEVRGLASALENIDPNLMRSHYQVRILKTLDIYRADILDENDEDRQFNAEILPLIRDLTEFIQKAAQANDAVLMRMG